MLSSALWCQSHKLDPNVHSTISGAHIDNTLECVSVCVSVSEEIREEISLRVFLLNFFLFLVIVKMFGKKS